MTILNNHFLVVRIGGDVPILLVIEDSPWVAEPNALLINIKKGNLLPASASSF